MNKQQADTPVRSDTKTTRALVKPAIELLSSQEEQGNARECLLEFKVIGAEKVLVNDAELTEKDGKYSQLIPLDKPSTRIEITATNGKKETGLSFYVKHSETKEEEASRLAGLEKEKQRLKDEAEAAQKKARLGDEAWRKSKAGKVCERYPSWSKSDCNGVAENKIWIGMTYDMLVEMWGKPTSANPSNFGNGTEWQWCWWDYTPSGFYDNNEDGKVDAYN